MDNTNETAEPSGASGGYPPTPPPYATVRERAVMEKFMRVAAGDYGFRCCLVGSPAMDIRFAQSHPTRDEADFCCYMLAKAIVFCGHEVCG
jgi:hypothetical protein